MRLRSIVLSSCLALAAIALPGVATANSLFPSFGFSPGFPLGYTLVSPTTNVKVGHLYVIAKGPKVGFADAQGAVFSEECYADFGSGALSKISTGDDVTQTDDWDKLVLGVNASSDPTGIVAALLKLIAPKFLPTITGSFELDGIDNYVLSDDGVASVEKSIGKSCKNDILKLQKQKLQVVIVTAAEKVSKLTLSSDAKLTGADSSMTLEKDNLYLGIKTELVPAK